MNKLKILSEYDLKDYQVTSQERKYDMKIGVFGIFDSININWSYYAVSFIFLNGITRNSTQSMKLTTDLSKSNSNIMSILSPDISNIMTHFRKFDTQHIADDFLKDFKLKWETASNNTSQIVRDEKLKEILDGKI